MYTPNLSFLRRSSATASAQAERATWSPPRHPKLYAGLVKLGDRVLVPLVARRDVRGLQHIPKNGPFLIVSNHRSLADPPVVVMALSRAGRVDARFVAAQGLWKVPGVGQALQLGAHLPVERGTAAAKDVLVLADDVYKAGQPVGIFPEGGIRLTEDGAPEELKAGASLFGLSHGIPIIPVVHWNTEGLIAKRSPFSRRPKIQVEVLPPVEMPRVATLGVPTRAEVDEGTARILAALRDGVGKLQQRA